MKNARTLAAAAGVAAVSAATLAYAVRVPSCSWLDGSVYRGTDKRRSIALTFDDGPSESTPELLEILNGHRAACTFFQCGANVRRLPSVAREVASRGHEIGNHSDSHSLFALRAPTFIADELALAQEAIEDATGIRPRHFRPPFGARWFGLRAAQHRLGLRSVMWTTLALDWKQQTPNVVSRLLQGATAGAILCLHDGRILERRPDIGVTLNAVREVVPKLIDRGFEFEKVTDILCPTKT
jgi:peptidoglycan-N-acetylglucosamine deacetylase